MTDKAAADLRIELDAMRLARAEDHKACARLAARVKELEAELARWRAETRAPPLPINGCTCRACEVLRRHQMDARRFDGDSGFTERRDRLAEGTRDEKAERCWVCGVPVPVPGNRCQLHARVNSCPPGAGIKECSVAACWKHGDIP